MSHVTIRQGLPGILGLFDFDPQAARPLRELAETILRRNSGIDAGERELIASYVSTLNGCKFCATSHASTAAHLLGERAPIVEEVRRNASAAPVSEKLKALLTIAARVQQDGRTVTSGDVAAARRHGATDQEIHDTVLIAAAFCMYNRYVDGLATWTPDDSALYHEMGSRLAAYGYIESVRV